MHLLRLITLVVVLQTLNASSILERLADMEANRSQTFPLNNLSEEDKKKILKEILLENLRDEDDYDIGGDNEDQNRPSTAKRGFFSKHHDIQIYYEVVRLKNGLVLLVPKDVNKNHYFIG